MIIKKFVGKTENEAVAAAKKELGEGIVIMNVKTVKKKGLAGFFGGKQVEVTVAMEREDPSLQAVRREAAKAAQAPPPAEPDRTAPEKATKAPGTAYAAESSQSIEKKLDSLQTLLVNKLQQEEARAEQARPEQPEEKEEEHGEEEDKKQENTEQGRFLRLLYNTMIENEVDERYANQIVEDVARSGKPDIPMDYILANVYQKMILKFGMPEGIAPAKKGPKIVIFMGPTGVGKTTTIAKLASNYSTVEQKKVALLTADTYRIAAAEQLRTYANILEVPFRVIYAEEEVKEAIVSFRDFDYIFVDTSGHSYQNEELLSSMKKLIASVSELGECQTFLVLSAGTKYHDLQVIASSYAQIADYQLIFTKLDETCTLGNLFNLKLYVDKAIAFVTTGQNVPDDIEQFNPQKIVKTLLSGRKESLK